MPEPRPDLPPDLDRTTDQPAAGAPSTGRRPETSVRSDAPAADAQTGAYAPGDAESVTGGYTPSDRPRRPDAGEPAVRGYAILGELGRGGMGVVYKARQVGLDRLVALKMILAGAHARDQDLERFRAEAQAVARFQHPNIVQIYEVGEADGLPFFSLEFVDGGTLAGKIAREPQAPRFAAETVEALARAMQYAHERGILHRDLKPANVLLAHDGTPKITDFGLAKRLEQDSGQTQAGAILGTPSYMAPEQALGQTARVGPATDVYALGATLYDLLTGRPPFAGTSVLETLQMVRTREPVPPGQLAAKLPKDLETVCLKCLQKDPARRYPGAGELADDLRRYLDGRPIVARPVGAAGRAWRWAKRNPWVAGLGSATAALLLAVAVITSVLSYGLHLKRNEAEANFRAAETAREREAQEHQQAELARAREEKAREIRDRQAIDALDALKGTSVFVDRELSRKLSLGSLRLRVQQVTLRELDKLRQNMAANPLAGRTEVGALQRIGDVYLLANRVKDAADVYQRAVAAAARFRDENPDDPVGLRNLAAVSNALADAELRLGDAGAARKRYADALALRLKWADTLRGRPEAWAGRDAVAKSHVLVGHACVALGEPADALTSFRAADAEYAAFQKPPTEQVRIRREWLEARDWIGVCLHRVGRPAEAEEQLRTVLKEREALLAAHPQVADLKRDVAFSHLRLGDFYLFDRRNPGRALAHYRLQYPAFRDAAALDPDDLELKRNLTLIQYRLGFATTQLAGPLPADAATALRVTANWHYLNCLRLRQDLARTDPTDTRAQIDVMLVQARLGRPEEAEKIAVGLLAQAGKDRRVLFQTACGLVIAGGGTGPAADRCRARAFQVLGALIDQGWKDRVTLETDPDLDAIRGDPQFADLVARIPK
jgi:eukaryotic-like serine/threonine-protein kinase